MASDQVKVAVRIRPFNPLDIGEHENVLRVVGQTISIQDYGVIKNRDFKYDYVFAPEGQGNRDEDQRKIFHTLGLDLLDNVWDGYNCTIFAYGQTGSGKSYSLMEYGKNKGFVARFVENLFEHIEKEDSVTCKVNLGMLEIYNEKVYDLLSDSKYRSPLKIKERGDGCFEANRLTKINVTEKTQVQKWIMQGYTNRSIAATEMNETSSRAHTIIAIGVWIMDNVHKVEKTSTINIVDLAGSERAKKANTSGKRFTEGNNINKSLLVLGQVIEIPYRESKLTMLLKNSLGGNSKTVMLATVHPLSNNIEETLSTLRYASRAMVIRNESKVNQTDLRMQVQELLNEIDSLHKQLKGVRSDENADKERLMKGNVLQVGGERPTDCPLNEYILLTGIGAKPNYAVLENQKGKVYVKAETGYVFVKGKELEKNLPRRLKHGYTVMFGQLSSMFVFIDQKAACKKNLEDKEASNISYASAKDDFIKFAEKDGTIKGDSLLRNMVVVRDQDIRNANALAIELNKPLTFELILVSDAFAGRKMGKLQIFIKVINKATECEYIWSEDYFLEKYEAMVAFTNKDESVKFDSFT
ncbi:kinesin-like protein KIF28P [Saccostrea echinata]|uniref:kinesin-like protein KIF28P n=1 Tax=Saccostrea echinata TaxID=191078 RepID=UPI002A805FD4|nr:kinesin-like protein KIF28P [Saccostrea echinata]